MEKYPTGLGAGMTLEETPAEEYAIALFDYGAVEDGELSLKDGERYTILQKDPTGWWVLQNMSGKKGFAPANYLEVKQGAASGKVSEVWRGVAK